MLGDDGRGRPYLKCNTEVPILENRCKFKKNKATLQRLSHRLGLWDNSVSTRPRIHTLDIKGITVRN